MELNRKKYSLIDIVCLVFINTPKQSSILLVLTIIDALMPSYMIYVTANFVDKALDIFKNGTSHSSILWPMFLLVIGSFIPFVCASISKLVEVSRCNLLRKRINILLCNHRTRLHYKYLDNNDSMDLISRVTDDMDVKLISQYNNIVGFCSVCISLLSILAVIFESMWQVSLLIALLFIPLFIVSMISGRKIYDVNKEVTKLERKSGYINEILKARDSLEERYVFSYTEKLNEKYCKLFQLSLNARKNVLKKTFFNMKTASIFALLCVGITAGFMLKPISLGIITIGTGIAIIQSMLNNISSYSLRLSEHIKELSFASEYCKELTAYSQLEIHDKSILETPLKQSMLLYTLEFKNVSFKYPGTDNYVLKNLSFKLKQGNHYAIVGANGSGKTTIVKLIVGLYDEYEGQILLNNKDLRTYSCAQIKSIFSVVSQNITRYQTTIYEALAIGNINEYDDINRIENVIKLLNFDGTIDKLPSGIHTHLGKINENGVDLSGGEWQKLSLARTLIKPSEVYILDEPTAALDPMSESNVYSQFDKINRVNNNSMTIFISHRLGSTKLADVILVMDKGELIEIGTHEKLMSDNMLYATMYKTQSDWYKD